MGRTSDAKERLIEGAMELIYALGYQGTGVEELCGRAGVQKGSFYHFFRSKQDLVLESLDRRWSLAREHMLEPIFGSGAPPLERIRSFFEATAAATAKEKQVTGRCGGCPFGNLAAEMSMHDSWLRLRVRGIFEEIAGYFERALIEHAARAGGPRFDPGANARSLVAYMEGMLLMARTYDDAEIMRRMVPGAVALATCAETAR